MLIWKYELCLFGNMNYVYLENASYCQSNDSYTKEIRQICSGVIFVYIVLISCNFLG